MVDALKQVGAEMANVAYNWAQFPGHMLTARECAMLRDLSTQWDLALAEVSRPQPEVVPREDRGAAPAPSREEVWLRIYAALAGALGCDGPNARAWADRALEEFDARFPPK
jgi:hypothetical protein